MENFVFYNPTKIIFGKGEENKIGEILKKDNIRKILFIYGKGSIKRTGLYERVVGSLKKANIEFIEYSGVKPNPLLSHTLEGIKIAKHEKVEAILAVGGGSVIDEGKAIAVGAVVKENIWIYFKHEKEVPSALPLYAILTLAATGTEMNGNAVITNEETKEKLYISSPYIYPKVSILNPELTFTVPSNYQAYAAVDVIAHAIELYFSGEVCPKLQSRFIEAIIKTVMEATENILINPQNYESRAEFMWASTLALNGLAQIGIKGGAFHNHMIAHAIGGLYDLPHGACLSIVIPAWMKWFKEKNIKQFERFAQKIFNKSSAEDGIESLKNWFKNIGAPVSLSEAGLPANAIDEIAKIVIKIAPVWNLSHIYTEDVIKEILSFAK